MNKPALSCSTILHIQYKIRPATVEALFTGSSLINLLI